MHIKTGVRESATDENFLRRSLDARPVGKLIAERAPDPYVQLD
jgi:hypothetical protein